MTSPHDYVLTLLASHLASFGVPLAASGSLWLPLECLWTPICSPGALVGPIVGGLGAFGFLSIAVGLPLAVLGGPFGRPGVPVGSFWPPWTASGRLLDLIQNRTSKCDKVIETPSTYSCV